MESIPALPRVALLPPRLRYVSGGFSCDSLTFQAWKGYFDDVISLEPGSVVANDFIARNIGEVPTEPASTRLAQSMSVKAGLQTRHLYDGYAAARFC